MHHKTKPTSVRIASVIARWLDTRTHLR